MSSLAAKHHTPACACGTVADIYICLSYCQFSESLSVGCARVGFQKSFWELSDDLGDVIFEDTENKLKFRDFGDLTWEPTG